MNSYNKKKQNIHGKGGEVGLIFFFLLVPFFFFSPYLSFSFRAEEESDFLIPFLLLSDDKNNPAIF